MMYRYGWGYPGGGFGLLSWVPAAIFWLILLLVLFKLFRHMDHSQTETPDTQPLDILKTRYAKGEIDKKQFEEMKKDISRES